MHAQQRIEIFEKRGRNVVLFKKISFDENPSRCQGADLIVYGRKKLNNRWYLVRLEFLHGDRILLAQATVPSEAVPPVSEVVPCFAPVLNLQSVLLICYLALSSSCSFINSSVTIV